MWHERLLDQTEYLKLCLTMKTIGFGMPFGPFPKSTTGLVGGPQWGQSIGCQLRTKHSFHNAMKCHQQVRQCHIAGVFGQRADTPCHVWWFQWWLVGVYPPSFQEHWGGAFSDFSCLDVYPKWRCPVFFCMGMVPVPPIISWDLLWVFKCKMAY